MTLHVRTKIALAAVVFGLVSMRTEVRSNDLPPHDAGLVRRSAEPPTMRAAGCELCNLAATMPVVHLDAAAVDSLGRAFSTFNETQVRAVDAAYRAGRLGPPESEVARQRAHLWTRLRLWTAYTYIAGYATDSTCIYEADESSLTEAFKNFTDPGLYPIVRLRRARMGMGRLCLDYDLSGELDIQVAMGTKSVRVRTRDLELDGQRRRVLAMDLPTGLDDMVEVYVDAHYSCSVEHRVEASPTGPYEVIILDDLEGLRMRRLGTHQPRAIVFWTAPRAAVMQDLPNDPRLGLRVYVPRLRLKLPSLLPDIGFDDLREVDLPQPILRLEYLKEGTTPAWLPQGRDLGFVGWKGHGSVPAELRARFPDL